MKEHSNGLTESINRQLAQPLVGHEIHVQKKVGNAEVNVDLGGMIPLVLPEAKDKQTPTL